MTMMNGDGGNTFWRKVFGDRRDQRLVLREAGFSCESEAAAWAEDLVPGGTRGMSELDLIDRVRRARPDLTLTTAGYIARHTAVRSA
ncbi:MULTISPECIES: hypothetical protein [Micrococcus]|uniref:Uncharacterized protein n=1 Tax=Micrococcus lylae TaxID=1273 RepID=A0ABY2K2Q6_9MICC|nr:MULTISPECIES: hypothetical protein [Micrococcus]OFR89527.1 hypothetical protein HMPREF2863_08910 [Micrococcus sp. HMSC067E09]PNL16983.1 hypothetical protein CEQ11_001335 [Micrococcus sp. FDAARGOS_333]TFH98697.1 hypothetical protein E4A49_07865 [Micrococcus lylae]WIK81740.1 hypothetical protein CJ228_009010 [Micrococcus lylae]